MGNVTNKQHYVFRAYLKKWTGSKTGPYGEKLWCLKKSEKRVFSSSTDKVLNKRQMYKIQAMNDDEKKFFELIMTVMNLTHTDKTEMREHIKAYLIPFSNQEIVNRLKKINKMLDNHALNDELQEKFENLDEMINKQLVDSEESFYSSYESDAVKWINSIIGGDADFYYKY